MQTPAPPIGMAVTRAAPLVIPPASQADECCGELVDIVESMAVMAASRQAANTATIVVSGTAGGVTLLLTVLLAIGVIVVWCRKPRRIWCQGQCADELVIGVKLTVDVLSQPMKKQVA